MGDACKRCQALGEGAINTTTYGVICAEADLEERRRLSWREEEGKEKATAVRLCGNAAVVLMPVAPGEILDLAHLQALSDQQKGIWRGPRGRVAPSSPPFSLPVRAPLVLCTFPPLHRLTPKNSKAFGGSGGFCAFPGEA